MQVSVSRQLPEEVPVDPQKEMILLRTQSLVFYSEYVVRHTLKSAVLQLRLLCRGYQKKGQFCGREIYLAVLQDRLPFLKT